MALSDLHTRTHLTLAFGGGFALIVALVAIGAQGVGALADLPGQTVQAQQQAASVRLWLYALGALGLAGGCITFWFLARSISEPLTEAIYIAETVGAGDLSQEFSTERGGEFGRLLGAMGHMEDILTDLVTRIKASSDGIAQAAREIDGGNTDLTARTHEQAAARTSSDA